jgi:hypothetical protein
MKIQIKIWKQYNTMELFNIETNIDSIDNFDKTMGFARKYADLELKQQELVDKESPNT